jgi:hypothetical protein
MSRLGAETYLVGNAHPPKYLRNTLYLITQKT